jgi:hypothetical protein
MHRVGLRYAASRRRAQVQVHRGRVRPMDSNEDWESTANDDAEARTVRRPASDCDFDDAIKPVMAERRWNSCREIATRCRLGLRAPERLTTANPGKSNVDSARKSLKYREYTRG